jgi:hypothetical protein
MKSVALLAVIAFVLGGALRAGEAPVKPGVVSHIKVVSDKVDDVSSLEAWKKSFIKDGMTDEQKGLAVWKSVVMFQYQDTPPVEYLQDGNAVQDPIKLFNVYGYAMCSPAASHVCNLARYAGLEARGWGINCHSVCEVKWDNAWHLLDASLVNYFPKADGKVASVDEITAAVSEWLNQNQGYRGNDAKLRAFNFADGGKGWKKGPDLLARCPFFDDSGWWPAGTHGWYSTMQEYDGSGGGANGKSFLFEYGSSMGYEVNIQLRPGEKLTRNWSNKGWHVNMQGGGGEPGCLKLKSGQGFMRHMPKYGDLATARIGNGTLEYDLPLAGGEFRAGALTAENLANEAASPSLRPKDPAQPGVLIFRMPSSYVYLGGQLTFKPVLAEGGEIAVEFSDNNGLDWKEIAKLNAPPANKEATTDLKPFVYRRYDYRLKFTLKGKGTGLDAIKVANDIQHSQRALPALTQGENKIAFSAGAQEGTLTAHGNFATDHKGKQVEFTDFKPKMTDLKQRGAIVEPAKYGGIPGELAYTLNTPGEVTRVRMGSHYRCWGVNDTWDYQVSFDDGKTFKSIGKGEGVVPGISKYYVSPDAPAGLKTASAKFIGVHKSQTCMFSFRVDADYKEPNGGFRPVKITYVWDENGQEKRDVKVADKPEVNYTINCAAKPAMKSIVLELAE